MRILVADDDAVSLHLMQRMLQQAGYEVVTATNGREAVDVLSDPNGPRLALIDWMMPELDGPGVCREIRNLQLESYVYILLLTARQSSEDAVNGLQAGADDYLTKPCHKAELKARLHTGRRVLQLENRLVEAREEMRYKATHDGLTSLWDRTAILSLLHSELSQSARTRKPVSVLVCDVDNFKQVNDTHGHPVGDEVLREVAVRLQRAVRSQDAVGRYGGEEFLVVLSACGNFDVRSRAEQVRLAISTPTFTTAAGPLFVSVSAGVTTIENWDESVLVGPYLQQADAALYRAKAGGRNLVMYAESLAGA